MIIMFAMLIPVVIWFALKLADCYEPELGLFDLLDSLSESLNYPLDIKFNEYSLKTVLVFLLINLTSSIISYYHKICGSD